MNIVIALAIVAALGLTGCDTKERDALIKQCANAADTSKECQAFRNLSGEDETGQKK